MIVQISRQVCFDMHGLPKSWSELQEPMGLTPDVAILEVFPKVDNSSLKLNYAMIMWEPEAILYPVQNS